MSTAAPFAAIFDWDGVIIDSSRAHEESWDRLATEAQKTLPRDHFVKGFGRKNEYIIPNILAWTAADEAEEIRRYSLRKEELYRVIVQERGQQALPGVETWLRRLQEAGVPCAIGSSTHRANVELILDLVGLRPYFQSIVTAEDVTAGKPDPQVFLTAAQRLATPPERCVVFEDAHVGIEAAHAGGMRVVAVTTTHPAEALTMADRVVSRLDELDVPNLAAWFPA